MKNILSLFMTITIIGMTFTSCGNREGNKEESKSEVVTESKEPHSRDYSPSEGEEDGTLYSIDYKYDKEENGVRLILSYETEENRFIGSIENVSDETIENIRVEIHLSNGKELGPTNPANLKPGERREAQLDTSGEEFETWSTHAEVGTSEHSDSSEQSGEREGEHGNEHEGEHK